MLDYKEVTESSFTKEVVTDDIVSENVLCCLKSSRAYLVILSSYAHKAKWQKINTVLMLLNSGVMFFVIPHIEKFAAGTEAGFLLMTTLYWLCTSLGLIFIASLFWLMKLSVSKSKVKALAIEQELALKGFFLRFVDKQIRPSVTHDFLAKNLQGNPSEFFVVTKSDDRKVGDKGLVLAGLYGESEEKVEVAIVLKFNKDYSKLELNNYHVNQRIAVSRFGGSDNDS